MRRRAPKSLVSLVSLVVLVTAVAAPLAQSLVARDDGCCAGEAGDRSGSHDPDRDSGAPSRCADRGCCVVSCHALAVAILTTVARAAAQPIDASPPPEAPDIVQPSGGIYRPPRA